MLPVSLLDAGMERNIARGGVGVLAGLMGD